MRVMLVTAVNGEETSEAALDLDQVAFAHPEKGDTVVYSGDDMSIKLRMPFGEFLQHWSGGNVLRVDPLTKSMTVENVIEEEE